MEALIAFTYPQFATSAEYDVKKKREIRYDERSVEANEFVLEMFMEMYDSPTKEKLLERDSFLLFIS